MLAQQFNIVRRRPSGPALLERIEIERDKTLIW